MDESKLNFLSTYNSEESENISNEILPTKVDWRNQANIGNFMPAIIKLENKQIHPDEIVEKTKESRLIHLATYYSYVNVVRTLLEIYKSDINVKNIYGHTPLHIICNNQNVDLFLFSYIIKNEMTNINETDKTNVTPIFYAVMSRFNIGFMTLIYMGANVKHTDIYGNNILYIALANNNKFALKFLLSNYDFNINKKFYDDSVSLGDLFISNKDDSCLRYLVKYHFYDINLNSINTCKKPKESFNFINKFNYELLNTVYSLKAKDYFSLLRKQYIWYNLQIALFLFIKHTKRLFKIIFFWIYLISLILYYINISPSNNPIFIKFIGHISIAGFISYALMWTFNLIKPVDNENKCPLNDRHNITKQIYFTLDNNPLDLISEEDICGVCLIKKEKDTNHCNSCEKCVKEFYFHSNFFNLCLSKKNIKIYLLFLLSMIFYHFSLIHLIYFSPSIEEEIYISDHFISNLVIFIIKSNSLQLLTFVFNLILFFMFLQFFFTIVICLGLNKTYYNSFRHHKRSSGVIVKRQDQYVSIPHSPITFKQFIINLIN